MIIRFKSPTILLLLCIFMLILTSCDPGSKIKYEIVNKTSKTLNIKYQFPGGPPTEFAAIAADSNKVIRFTNELGYADDINRRKDSMYFYSFVVRHGNKISRRNFKDKKYWRFKKSSDLEAAYTLIIDDTFFTK